MKKLFFLKTSFIFTAFILITGCSSSKYSKLRSELDKTFQNEFFTHQFTGFLVVDPANGDTLYNENSDKYFTPASNVKIFTLFAGLQLLNDSIPAAFYRSENDTLFLKGTGDPSFLHNFFKDSTILKLAESHTHTIIDFSNYQGEKYGPGWAWEDYDTYFSPEVSPFPIYGNVLTVNITDSIIAAPSAFYPSITFIKEKFRRAPYTNDFFIDSTIQDTIEIPFITDEATYIKLWKNLIGNKISIRTKQDNHPFKTIYSIPSDSLYKRMMHISDNFLAEQILILASSTLSDTLESARTISSILSNELKEIPQPPRWVDGSGLSRYNIFTPQSIVFVLEKLYRTLPDDKWQLYFPAGGQSGTLKNWYKSDGKPFIYAKSGTLGNNYNLSGFLITKSGKTLVFSYMNNHFLKYTSSIKRKMEEVFSLLYNDEKL